jgi:hypothetical protein
MCAFNSYYVVCSTYIHLTAPFVSPIIIIIIIIIIITYM